MSFRHRFDNSHEFDNNGFAFDSLGDQFQFGTWPFGNSWTAGPHFAQFQPVGVYSPGLALPDLGADAHGGSHGGGPGGGGGGGGKPGGNLLTTYTSGDSSVDDAFEFNILINFSGKWTAEQQSIVTWAADFFSQIITDDIRDDTDLAGNFLDDVVIEMSTGRIDGKGHPLLGNILAQTEITAVRDPDSIDEWLPVTASIKLDSTDLKDGTWSGAWDTIVAHEMAHALGFVGPIFNELGLIDAFGNFTGANAVAAYGGVVPLEDSGGSGTAGSHWDEDLFLTDGANLPNELLTGFISPDEETVLSDTTVGALADLGYTVQDPSSGASYLTVDSGVLLA
jgi:hypothetical protein